MGSSAGSSSLAGGAASSFGVIGAGLTAYADYEKGKGIQAADEYKAATLERAAEYGDLKATQTNAQLTRNMNITLGNIDAVRSAAHTNITSPTGEAVRDYAEEVGTERKGIEVSNILSQVKQQEADAAYLKYAGNQALLGGEISAGVDFAGSIAKGLSYGKAA